MHLTSLFIQKCLCRSTFSWMAVKGKRCAIFSPPPTPHPTQTVSAFSQQNGLGLPQPQGPLCHYTGPVQQRLMGTCGQTPSDACKDGDSPDVVHTAGSELYELVEVFGVMAGAVLGQSKATEQAVEDEKWAETTANGDEAGGGGRRRRRFCPPTWWRV